jgi:YHS domain-containing protein
MLRGIVLVILLLLLIPLLLPLLRTLFKMFDVLASANQVRDQPASTPKNPSDELIRDPVCGTYVPASSQYRLVNGAQVIRFCSAECRDRYKA